MRKIETEKRQGEQMVFLFFHLPFAREYTEEQILDHSPGISIGKEAAVRQGTPRLIQSASFQLGDCCFCHHVM